MERRIFWIVIGLALVSLAPFGILFVGLQIYLFIAAGTIVVCVPMFELCYRSALRYEKTGRHPWEPTLEDKE